MVNNYGLENLLFSLKRNLLGPFLLSFFFFFFFVQTELEIEPRYPLFGGWKSSFVIGYRLPLQDFNFKLLDVSQGFEGKFYLNFSFGCPLIETVVKKLTVNVRFIFLNFF